ncbi:MAG TPA: flagellar assembly peptidoglycan hydrolase FlgJ [Steroidobacteraceae bacterium]|jgi:flagellar protein FlgJ|nr:flagellar assembly peptidoglycan hydrolase FlgJ [Steroidobacteraceae bacterium]
MSVPLVDSNSLAATGGLSALKQAAANGNPQALREAARQFESLFTSMMLKSMQEANFKDPVFGSDQGDLYQEMYDDQVAAEMSKGKGLGLADMLVQQLRRGGLAGTSSSGTLNVSSIPASAQPRTAGPAGLPPGKANGTASTSNATTGANTSASAADACPSSAQQAAFAHSLWPDAQQAAKQLGVNPVTLLAQAALETNWGRSVPQGAGGATSNNLFGIKASSTWSGPAVSNSTLEYSGGSASTLKAQFRSYGSASQCFQDYVDLLKSNPRYEAALGTGSDVQAFGSALQQGGYATDPAYASKLTAVAGTLAHALTQAVAATAGSVPSGSLKFAADLPTTDGSGTLQRR